MAQIFADGFESGDISVWDATAGSPTVSGDSALIGTCGCEIDADSEYVRDNSTAVGRFRVRIYVDPDSVSISTGAVFTLLGAMETNTPCGRIRL